MPGFFATVGTPLMAGRDFTEMDNENAPEVAIFSETMARFFFGDENPVGKRFNARGGTDYPIEIIGVVKDAKPGTPRDQRGVWYGPYRQGARFMRLNWCIAARTNGRPLALATERTPGAARARPEPACAQDHDDRRATRLRAGAGSTDGHALRLSSARWRCCSPVWGYTGWSPTRSLGAQAKYGQWRVMSGEWRVAAKATTIT